MNTKEYLRQYRRFKYLIIVLQKQLSEAKAQAAALRAIDYTKDKVQTSPRDAMADSIAKIDEIAQKTDKKIMAMLQAQEEIINTIDKLENVNNKTLLYCIYVHGYTLQKTADVMHYSTATIDRIHRRAINEVKTIVK